MSWWWLYVAAAVLHAAANGFFMWTDFPEDEEKQA